MALVYQAIAKIYYNGVLAYAIGDRVPDANVTLYGYNTLGLVQQVTVADPAAPLPGVDLTTQAEFDAWKTTASSTYSPVWQPTTAYAAGQAVVNPTGDVVTAKVAFTSGAAYSATNWNLSPTYAVLRDFGVFASRYGVVADGVADDTAAMQAAIDAGVAAGLPVICPPGTILTGPLNLNGTGHATPANAQWPGLTGFYGAGYRLTTFKARAGLYTAADYVLTHNNVSGVIVKGFRIDGAGVATKGGNFSWIGGSSGNPALAPSNLNVYEDIFGEGCSDLTINFDQQHDSKLTNIKARQSTNIGISANSPGGLVTMENVIVSGGTFNIACQNAQFSGCAFFGGVVVMGAGYNHINWGGTQIYPNPATGVTIDSTATGNASRGMVFTGAFFPVATTVVRGRFHQGIEFIGCMFNTYTNFFGTVTPASGTGQLPVFTFRHCSFESTAPAGVASQARVVIESCRSSAGLMIDAQTWSDFTPVWQAGGVNVTLGAGVLLGRWVKRGGEVHYRVTATLAADTVIPAGAWTITLPAVVASVGRAVGSLWLLDATGLQYAGVTRANGSSTAMSLIHPTGVIDLASPFTWATSDQFVGDIVYETA